MIRTANQLLRGRPEDRAARAGVTVTTDRRTVTAYVNHGRWVADCPYCNGGIACQPDEPGVCYSCGHSYKVAWPKHREQAEAVLAKRDIPKQNWYPARETVDDLKAENLRHGVGV